MLRLCIGGGDAAGAARRPLFCLCALASAALIAFCDTCAPDSHNCIPARPIRRLLTSPRQDAQSPPALPALDRARCHLRSPGPHSAGAPDTGEMGAQARRAKLRRCAADRRSRPPPPSSLQDAPDGYCDQANYNDDPDCGGEPVRRRRAALDLQLHHVHVPPPPLQAPSPPPPVLAAPAWQPQTALATPASMTPAA